MGAPMWRVGGNVALMKLAEVAAGVIEFVLLHLGDLTLRLQQFAIPTLQLHQLLDDREEALLVKVGIKPGGNLRDAWLEREFRGLALVHLRPGTSAHGLAFGFGELAP